MSNEGELLACPFCGHVAIMRTVAGGKSFRVTCTGCAAYSRAVGRKEYALEIWNARTPSPKGDK